MISANWRRREGGKGAPASRLHIGQAVKIFSLMKKIRNIRAATAVELFHAKDNMRFLFGEPLQTFLDLFPIERNIPYRVPL